MRVARRALVILGLAVASVSSSGTAWAQPPAEVVFPPFNAAACVGKPQHLLVFDMKSGWWSNDGAEFHNLLLPRIVKDCPTIDIEYYFLQHIEGGLPTVPGLPPSLPGGIVGFVSFYPKRPGIDNDGLIGASPIPTRPWGEYSQIWLLSGSDLDPTDVPTTHEFFQNMVTKLTTIVPTAAQPLPGLFVGTGIGNLDHANKLLTAMQLPAVFQSHLTENDTPGVGDGSEVAARTRVRVGVELSPHALFEGVESIADVVGITSQDYETDFLPVANNPFTLIGRNGKGEPSIGVRETAERRFVIDAGMQRYYSLFKPEEVGTYRYLQNIIKYLAK